MVFLGYPYSKRLLRLAVVTEVKGALTFAMTAMRSLAIRVETGRIPWQASSGSAPLNGTGAGMPQSACFRAIHARTQFAIIDTSSRASIPTDRATGRSIDRSIPRGSQTPSWRGTHARRPWIRQESLEFPVRILRIGRLEPRGRRCIDGRKARRQGTRYSIRYPG